MGLEVTALDISPKAVEVMTLRGVKNVALEDVFSLMGEEFDTLLMMMNGIGLAGTIGGLHRFFAQARKLLRPGGRLIFDSSDIAYLYEGKIPVGGHYYGEILYQYEYKEQRGDWFKWLFIDRKTLKAIAAEEGWVTELLFEDNWDQYLVKCEMR
jgi:SAM-dependent methyltransferase